MNFLNESTGVDLHEKAKEVMGGGPTRPEQHDFFKPLNEMDPHQKKKTQIPIPKYKFKIFLLSGPHASDEEEGLEYTKIMDQVTVGKYQLMGEQTYHSREGDIRVFLRWLELPKELWPETAKIAPTDAEFDAMMPGEKAPLALVSKTPSGPPKKKKKRKPKARKPKSAKKKAKKIKPTVGG